MNINIRKGKSRINVNVKKLSLFSMGIGLMFKTRNTKNLLFDFGFIAKHTIHSYFVFFPFLAVWLDERNKVINSQLIRPFSGFATPKRPAVKLVEIPVNSKNAKIIRFFVGKRKI